MAFLSGLCKSSPLDLSYELAAPFPSPNGREQRRTFAGPTGWQITYSKEEKTWTIVNPQHHDKNVTLISTEEVFIPTGKNTWKIANNTCNNGVTNVQQMLLRKDVKR